MKKNKFIFLYVLALLYSRFVFAAFSNENINQLLSACAIDICGHPKENKSVEDLRYSYKQSFLNDHNKLLEWTEKYKQEIEPVQRLHLDFILELEKNNLIFIIDFLNENKKSISQPKKENYFFHNFKNSFSSYADSFSVISVNSLNDLIFDEKKTLLKLENNPYYYKPVSEKIVQFLNLFYNTSKVGKEVFPIMMKHDSMNYLIKDRREFSKELVKNFITAIDKWQLSSDFIQYMKVNQKFEKFFDQFNEISNKILNSEDLKPYEMYYYTNSQLLIYSIFVLFSEKEIFQDFFENLIEEPISFALRTDLLNRVLNYQEQLFSNLSEELKEKILEDFFKAYIENISSLTSSKDLINEKEKFISKIKNSIFDNVFPKFSKQTQIRLKEKIDQTTFNLPLNQSSYHESFKFLIEQDFYSVKKINKNSPNDPSFHETILLSFYDSFNLQELLKFGKVVEDLKKPLRSFIDKFINAIDEVGPEDSIRISLESFTHSDLGKSVVAHEIGHLIYKYLKKDQETKKKLLDISNCLDSRHQNESHYIKNQYVKEDFSDLISALSQPKEKFFICSLLEKDERKESYQNLSLVNSDPNDKHSSSLFRILHFHQVSHGNLPSSCIEALNAINHPISFDSCFD